MQRTFSLPIDTLRSARQAARHPDLSAALARVPLAGRAVPGRTFWRTQPIDVSRMTARAKDEARGLAGMAEAAWRPRVEEGIAAARAWRRTPTAPSVRQSIEQLGQRYIASAQATRGRARAPRASLSNRARVVRPSAAHRVRPWLFAAMTALAGAAAMYFADPNSGRRRRALVKDKAAHLKRVVTRNVPRAAERRSRFLRGKLEGVRHEVQEFAAVGVHPAVPDNETLVARVRSEVLRRTSVKPGEIHVDAYEGCVTLRGEIRRETDIRDLVEATRHVGGVQEVRSYLHLPGTVPPNKAESFAVADNGALPAHLAR